jgi:hypothetical protein
MVRAPHQPRATARGRGDNPVRGHLVTCRAPGARQRVVCGSVCVGWRCEPSRTLRHFNRRKEATLGWVSAGARTLPIRSDLWDLSPRASELGYIVWQIALHGLRTCVEQQVRDVDRADAVDHAVMSLAPRAPNDPRRVLRGAPSPTAAAALEPVRPELCRPLAELRLTAGGRQGGSPERARDVERLVGQPRRPGEPAGRGHGQVLAEAGHRAQPLEQQLADRLDGGGAAVGSGSKIITAPVCMWALGSASSGSRNVASSGLTGSDTARPATASRAAWPRIRPAARRRSAHARH